MSLQLNSFIKIKPGITNEDSQTDMSGWTGRIIEAGDFPEVEWDNETLAKLPHAYTKQCEDEGLNILTFCIAPDDADVVEKGGDFSKTAQAKVLQMIDERHEGEINENDPDDVNASQVLESNDIRVNEVNLLKYEAYLDENLSDEVILTGREVFRWEERYTFGGFSPSEYRKLKKTRASYSDTFKMIEFIDPAKSTRDRDLEVKVRRVSDRKMFTLPLSWLEAKDESSPDYGLLENFSIWIVNY